MSFSANALKTFMTDNLGLDAAGVDDQTPLFTSSLLDSFSMIELIEFIESSAGIRISPTDVNLDNLDSLDRIMKYVASVT
jgi:acyl carrier protein